MLHSIMKSVDGDGMPLRAELLVMALEKSDASVEVADAVLEAAALARGETLMEFLKASSVGGKLGISACGLKASRI